jgi:hypothetical protein
LRSCLTIRNDSDAKSFGGAEERSASGSCGRRRTCYYFYSFQSFCLM